MAEFGFFGVRVITCMHVPRLNGLPLSDGAFDFAALLTRGDFIN
jgi:hypothetical protein